MAQLDILSYFTQLIWLIVILGSFYVIIIRKILPEIKRVFKVRALMSKTHMETVTPVLKSENKLLINTLEIVNEEIKEITEINKKLTKENIKGKNKKELKEANIEYLKSITKLLITK